MLGILPIRTCWRRAGLVLGVGDGLPLGKAEDSDESRGMLAVLRKFQTPLGGLAVWLRAEFAISAQCCSVAV